MQLSLNCKIKRHNRDDGVMLKSYNYWTFPISSVLKTTHVDKDVLG